MAEKAYMSAEYYAQTLAKFLRDSRGGRTCYWASQSGGTVRSRVAHVSWIISFKDGENPVFSLEASVGDDVLSSVGGVVKVKRGPSGRISGNQWERFYTEKIFPFVRDALRKRPAPSQQ